MKQHSKEISVCLVEKGSEIGAHILSGNIFETKALNELFPNWKTMENVKKINFIKLSKLI